MKNVQRGEIYFANLNPVIGCEQDGIRPVLIIQNNTGNAHSPTTIIAAMTSKKNKLYLPGHVKVSLNGDYYGVVMLEHIRTIDKRRLTDYVGKLNSRTMKRIDNALSASLAIDLE